MLDASLLELSATIQFAASLLGPDFPFFRTHQGPAADYSGEPIVGGVDL